MVKVLRGVRPAGAVVAALAVIGAVGWALTAFPNQRLGVAALLAVIAAVGWALMYIPPYQAKSVTFEGPDADQKKAQLINEYRRTTVQVITGVFVVVGALSGALFTWQQIHTIREGQITDRFTKAIAQLADEKSIAARVGGIHALERIARDSEKDHWAVVETLTAFIRENAPAPESGLQRESMSLPTQRTDIQAALTVLGRRERIREPHQPNLSRTDLARADLQGTYLSRAFLEGTYLERARLSKADLTGAHLEGADLTLADLEKTDLTGAHLTGAFLERAAFTQAGLERADLRGAHLWETDLRRAKLLKADLTTADLERAHLEGADLREAKVTVDQLRKAFVDANTRLPAGITLADLKKP